MEKLKLYDISGYEYDVFEVTENYFYVGNRDDLWVKWGDCEAFLLKLYRLMERCNDDEAYCILEEILGLSLEGEQCTY